MRVPVHVVCVATRVRTGTHIRMCTKTHLLKFESFFLHKFQSIWIRFAYGAIYMMTGDSSKM